MIRRRSRLIDLNSFFFTINIKKKNRNFLKKTRRFFFIKRSKLFTKRRYFNNFSLNLIFNVWANSQFQVNQKSGTYIFINMSTITFFWFGFLLQKSVFSKTYLTFSFSLINLFFKLRRGLYNGYVINSFYNTLNNVPSKVRKSFFSNYLVLSNPYKTTLKPVLIQTLLTPVSFYKLLI